MSQAVPANIIFPFYGTHAQAGALSKWARDTTFDGKFLKATASGTNPNTTGGASTHTHSSPSHTHALNAHTHTYTLSYVSDGPSQTSCVSGVAGTHHSHTGTSGARSGGTTNGTSVTYSAYSNSPPYTTVIFIKASAGAVIPVKAIAFWNTGTPPSNWNKSDGNNSTLNLTDKYLLGAATGANAGGTGGALTNTHAINHTHTTNTHTHSAANSGIPIDSGSNKDGGPRGSISTTHRHAVTMNASTQALNTYTGNKGTGTVEPAYKKIFAIQKATGGLKKKGVIGMWTGTLATIPTGWNLCDGTEGTPDLRSKYMKITNTSGSIGATGGSNTHTHTAEAHAHTASGTHTHTAPNQLHTDDANIPNESGCAIIQAVDNKNHTVGSISSSAPAYANGNTTANSSSNEPAYRTVAFIQFDKDVEGGAVAMNFL